MTSILARKALLPDGWADDVMLRIRDGRITERWGEWDGMDLLAQLGLWKPC